MRWDSSFAKLATYTAKGTFRAIKGRVPPARYKQLLSAAVAQLLDEHPDIDAAEAGSRAARATGAAPSTELFRADGASANRGGRKPRPTANRAVRKTVARKKNTRKKAVKKQARRTTATSKARRKTTRRKAVSR